MLIVCPNCATSYDVDLARLGSSGRQVRCVRCRTVWHAELPHAEQLLAAAEALGPAPTVPAMAEAEPAFPPPDVEEVTASQVEPGEAAAASDQLDELPLERAAPPMDEAASAKAANTENEFAIETESPSLAPTDLDAGMPPPVEVDAAEPEQPTRPLVEDIETVASRRRHSRDTKRRRWRWPLSALQTAMMTLFVLDAIIVGWRTDFVRAMPETASFFGWVGMPVNLRGLDFDSVATTTEQHDGMPILVIGGNILNDTNGTVNVPHLRFAVRNAAHQEIYSWTAVPARATLPPGEAISFHTRLASPPVDAHDVLVRFLTRYDMLRGSH
jgi:predicted Zn finger-like uncharacterized protein